jgi:rSAM/selenodomain-associated transferase 2
MISVVIPTLNAARGLEATLSPLVPAAIDGIIRELIIVDGGSDDDTIRIADAAGAEIVRSERGRGRQMMAGADRARFPWLLFLHADTVLEPGWEREAAAFIDDVMLGRRAPAAAVFRFALDDHGVVPRTVEFGVGLRCAVLRLPYGDQGLLLPATLYREIGGYRPMGLMEDVDIIRRLGRQRVSLLRARAVTAATRFRRDGYPARIARNLTCLTLYYLRVPERVLTRLYR